MSISIYCMWRSWYMSLEYVYSLLIEGLYELWHSFTALGYLFYNVSKFVLPSTQHTSCPVVALHSGLFTGPFPN